MRNADGAHLQQHRRPVRGQRERQVRDALGRQHHRNDLRLRGAGTARLTAGGRFASAPFATLGGRRRAGRRFGLGPTRLRPCFVTTSPPPVHHTSARRTRSATAPGQLLKSATTHRLCLASVAWPASCVAPRRLPDSPFTCLPATAPSGRPDNARVSSGGSYWKSNGHPDREFEIGRKKKRVTQPLTRWRRC